MSADVTVFAFVWGSSHNHFIAGWDEAIRALDPAPAEVLVATRPDDPADVYGLPYRIVESPLVGRGPGFLNDLVGLVGTGWVAECDIDDRLYSDAFGFLGEADRFHACANAIRSVSTGVVHRSQPQMFGVAPRQNWVMVNSYFRKDVWDRVGGYDLGAYWHDWAFWWKLYANGGRWFYPDGVQMLYNDVPSPFRATDNPPVGADESVLRFIDGYQPVPGGLG